MLDARGLSCPLPVLMAKDEVEKNHSKEFSVLVDNETAVENIKRFAANRGYNVFFKEHSDEYEIHLVANK